MGMLSGCLKGVVQRGNSVNQGLGINGAQELLTSGLEVFHSILTAGLQGIATTASDPCNLVGCSSNEVPEL